MPFPDWQAISSIGPEVLTPRPAALAIAVAEIDASGVIVSANEHATALYGWNLGYRLAYETLIALHELHPGTSRVLSLHTEPHTLIGMRLHHGHGWLLMGHGPPPAPGTNGTSRFKSLIEKIPVLVLRMQADGTVLYANHEAERMTGLPVETMVGRPFWRDAVHPEDRWKMVGAVRRALEGRKAIVGLRFHTDDQQMRSAEMHLFPPSPERPDEFEAVVFDVTEQSEVEEALFQSEVLYRTFLEQSPMGLLHIDEDGRITFENHQFRRLIGESPTDTWIGQNIYTIRGLDPKVHPLLKAMISDGEAIQDAAITYRPKRNEPPQILIVRASPIRKPEGDIVGGVLTIEDVTQERRRDAELALRSRYSQAESALREAALATADEDAFLQKALAIIGGAAQADQIHVLLKKADGFTETRSLWAHEDRDHAYPVRIGADTYPVLQDLEDEKEYLYIYFEDSDEEGDALLNLTGAVEALWTPIQEGGLEDGLFVIERTEPRTDAWGATEHTLMHQVVKLFETLWAGIQVAQRYRLTVTTIDDCLFNFMFEGRNRRYLFVTPQIEALTGQTVDAMLGKDQETLDWGTEVVFEEDQEAVQQHDNRLRSGHESRLTYRVRTTNDQVRWLREHATAQRDALGEVVVSGILMDVTDQKRAEEVLVQAKQEAESSNRLKSALIATMSHEIRTPMGAVKGFSDLLGRELEEWRERTGQALPPQVDEFVEAIQENSKRLLDLINDLFDLSNLEITQLQRSVTPLHRIIEEATDAVSSTLARKGIRLKLDLASHHILVLGDPKRVRQVLDNLLTNAAKFTDAGSVTIRTTTANGEAMVEVIDTGVGMSEEYLKKLFTPFMQEDNRLNRNFEGTGLGLALVKRLMDLMGGRIEVESEKGKGSTFRLYLPEAEAP